DVPPTGLASPEATARRRTGHEIHGRGRSRRRRRNPGRGIVTDREATTMRQHAVRILAIAGAATLALSACGRDSGGGGGDGDGGEVEASPGITDEEITFGITTPLSGPTAGPGTCTVAGVTAYMERRNEEGGIEFGDGQTRTVQIRSYDDAYDPSRAVSNFRQMINDGVFGDILRLGTPTNLAV